MGGGVLWAPVAPLAPLRELIGQSPVLLCYFLKCFYLEHTLLQSWLGVRH